MKRTWKKLWARRPRLSRGGKILRNLALTALAAGVLWYIDLCPALTKSGALREMERSDLISPGQTLYTEPRKDGELVFVLGDTYAYTGVVQRRTAFLLPFSWYSWTTAGVTLDQGPALLPLAERAGVTGRRQEGSLFCPRGPEGAYLGQLTLTCDYSVERLQKLATGGEQVLGVEHGTEEFRAEVRPDERGVYHFVLRAGNDEEEVLLCEAFSGLGDRLESPDGTLRRYDVSRKDYQMDFCKADGTLLDTVRGTLSID